jgi:hypothetical protein
MKIPILIFCCLFAMTSSAQLGYISTDSSISRLYIVSQKRSKQSIQVVTTLSKNSRTKTYNPTELTEYGVPDYMHFESRLLTENDTTIAYFFERLVNGNAKLFALYTAEKTRYFIEKDKQLVELLNDGGLKEQLSAAFPECGNASAMAGVRGNRKSLQRFFRLSNECFPGLFPATRKGITAGYFFPSLSLQDPTSKSVTLSAGASPFFGAFVELPMGKSPHWKLHAQALYQKVSYAVYQVNGTSRVDYVANTSAISMPVLFKYMSTNLNFRPYFQFGPGASYYLTNDNYMLVATGDTVIEIDKKSMNSISKLQVNGIISAGSEISLSTKIALGLEARYEKGLGLGGERHQNVSAFSFLASLYF